MLPNPQAMSALDRLSTKPVRSGCDTSELEIRLRDAERKNAALLSLCARQNDAIIRMRAGLVTARSALLFLKRDPFVLVESELTNMRLASDKLLEFAATATTGLELAPKRSFGPLVPSSPAFLHHRTEARRKVEPSTRKVFARSINVAGGLLMRAARSINALLPTSAQRAIVGSVSPLANFRHKITRLVEQLWALSEV